MAPAVAFYLGVEAQEVPQDFQVRRGMGGKGQLGTTILPSPFAQRPVDPEHGVGPFGCDVAAAAIRARIANLGAARAADPVFELEQRRIELGAASWTGDRHDASNDTLSAAGRARGGAICQPAPS